MAWEFDGDFDLLPLRAHILYGPVPEYPTDEDFHLAASHVFHDEGEPAAHWRIEAVRWRRQHGGRPMDLKVIAQATAKRLYEWRFA